MKKDNKYGIIVVPGHSPSPMKNIGDYVQSLAALQFVPNLGKVVYLDREQLNTVKQDDDSEIKTIMNGWWMGNPVNFPPAKVINPLYVSFHLRPRIEKSFFTEKVIKHLRINGPVGCRDENTVRLMKAHGIDAYFSGCLTLTLGLTLKHHETNAPKVYFVDPYVDKFFSKDIKASLTSLLRSISCFVSQTRKIARIARQIALTSNMKRGTLSLYIYATKVYSTYSNTFSQDVFENAVYLSHSISKSKYPTDEKRFQIARELLEKYSKAKYVVTSKIHCGLPCLGIGTPVILVVSSGMIRTGRMGRLKDFFRKGFVESGKCKLEEADFSLADNEKITLSYSFSNYDVHLPYAHDLIERCEKFIAN